MEMDVANRVVEDRWVGRSLDAPLIDYHDPPLQALRPYVLHEVLRQLEPNHP